ncbi:MAG: tetratricopeptide repeat protein, partial [Spirochaetes bacterium]|nr:tetratricopeptide repeat protein [Spirochaetota bacterium]
MRAAIVAIAALLAWGCAARPEGARLSAARERALAAYAAAASAYDSGRLEQAEGLAESSLEAEATFLPSLTLLGKAAYLAGDDAGAERALRKAVRASPRAGEAALWLARTYRATGRPGLAMSACETILSSDPSSVAALRLAATLSTDSGD